jgi:hypothetical protein
MLLHRILILLTRISVLGEHLAHLLELLHCQVKLAQCHVGRPASVVALDIGRVVLNAVLGIYEYRLMHISISLTEESNGVVLALHVD